MSKLPQLTEEDNKDSKVAVIKTNKGDITVKLFLEETPHCKISSDMLKAVIMMALSSSCD